MNLLEIVKSLEGKSDSERKTVILDHLKVLDLVAELQKYSIPLWGEDYHGENIIVKSGKKYEIGIGSHYDAVPLSPGANDNASAVSVTLDLLKRFKERPLKNIGIRAFFFDDEEEGLVGSKAYIKSQGLNGLIGLYNMEIVGRGDKIAIWGDEEIYNGKLLTAFKEVAESNNTPYFLFPQIGELLSNTGDHRSFNEAGLKEAFCITTISREDLEVALKYLAPLKTDPSIAKKVYSEAPLFRHYHKPTDNSKELNERTLQLVSNLIYKSIMKIDSTFSTN